MFNGERSSSYTMSPIGTKIYMMIAYYMPLVVVSPVLKEVASGDRAIGICNTG